MSAKSVCLCALILSVLGVGVIRADYPATTTNGNTSTTPDSSASATPAKDSGLPPPEPVGLSRYILGDCPECCGPIGGCGPVQMELYVRMGASLPVAGPIFGHTLETGWIIAGGGRSLFFNAENDAAWTIDLGLSNDYNQGQHSDRQFRLNHIIFNLGNNNLSIVDFVPGRKKTMITTERTPVGTQGSTFLAKTHGVTIRSLNRTFANLSLGREWYLNGNPATCAENGGWIWRAGFDVGGRYGTAKLETHETKHRTDVVGGFSLAAHTDVEIPCGCCIFQYGLRIEWDYIWSDILQIQNDADMQDLNILFTAGVRF
jgi:hypothetical protein